jgi:MazG family protein
MFMREWSVLLEVADRLLGPNGCPWDREQTLFTLQPYLLEELHELIEAIDSLDGDKISEELGDVFYALVFVAKLGEKEELFSLTDALKAVTKKLIRRHPHVFGHVKAETSEEIIRNWEQIKQTEYKERKNILDGIPSTLPALSRAQKMISKMKRAGKSASSFSRSFETEGELGDAFWELLILAEANGWNAEDLVRRTASRHEKTFREEKTPEMNS